jgi:hypothetical protein
MERRVRFDHEDLDAVRMMIRADGLEPGTEIEVEVGARWTLKSGSNERIGGVWVPCRVVTESPRELVVRLL